MCVKKKQMNQKTTSFGVELDQRQEGGTQPIWQVVSDRGKVGKERTRVHVQ